MITNRVSVHEQSWLQLPWLANGRLAGAERAALEAHVAACSECAQELARQRLLCEALAEPDRVTYAPGPSFRKLMERIDGPGAPAVRPPRAAIPRLPVRGATAVFGSAWRPPGLAWAATFVLAVGLAAVLPSIYRMAQPRYATYTDTAAAPRVLYVAFDRALPLGDLERLLQADGARIVEGPNESGVFGVAPVAAAAAAGVTPQMRALAARLRADARVRWVQPLPAAGGSDSAQDSRHGGP
jgi:hypothetical protein